MDDTNPYRPPLETAVSDKTVAKSWLGMRPRLLWGWPFVFSLNLILPLILGWQMTQEAGRWGMGVAIAILLTLGWYLCVVSERWAHRLLVGGLAVACCQLMPFLHLIVGIMAFDVAVIFQQAQDLSFESDPKILTEGGGGIVTLLMGSLLAVLALAFGWMISALTDWVKRKTGVIEEKPTLIDLNGRRL